MEESTKSSTHVTRGASESCAKLLDMEWEVTNGMRIDKRTKRTNTSEMGNHLGSTLVA